MICAIHQPNFVPWLPYFRKIAAADIFVILTEAQFSRDYYQQRFNFNKRIYTMSVVHGNIPIADKQYANPFEDWTRIKTSLNNMYRKEKYGDLLSVFDDCINISLCKTNVAIIFRACTLLGIDISKIRFDVPTELLNTDRLIMLCKLYGADAYLSGNGALKYLDDKRFAESGLKLVWQDVPDTDKLSFVETLYRNIKL